ncbi:hypothetical protein ASPZODRAFT_147387 [Penicilliopsis zonata CBS 506.65]|uniref:Uncharacterized protein n=1 Tax=Penicilliopsis zonata CBS 506.65 TaxID=1073090 RepID=A0A1L9S5G6_9EURO|nr:hypothetical protein ASPZODRAFT_147387 [Penicilliopsis zonata CBS 506.65]OJJ42401.1 hypothetical protein ASPZODRAFT_147387 [Penicilliopsis zonata CBS 506.65]
MYMVAEAVFLAIGLSLLVLIIMLIYAVYPSRQLVSQLDTKTTVMGRPLFFPVVLAHNRVKPVRDQFHHHMLLVGVPVGLCGHIGNVLSITDKSWKKSWFHIESGRYLGRGDGHLSLEEKLHCFLRDLNLDPSRWPYAYLLTTPRWLWWFHNPLSWWYLYSAEGELDAVIMEVNSFYGEKRNFFFHVEGYGKQVSYPQHTAGDMLDAVQSVESVTSASRFTFYKGSWQKHLFTTPYEKVEGSMAVRVMDPIKDTAWSDRVSFSNLTSISPEGDARLAARMTCCEAPVDPMRVSALTLASFLLRWSLPVTLAKLQILYHALRIRYTGLMSMTDRPVIRRGSLPHPASRIEKTHETFFREYLSHRVKAFPDALELCYLPSRGISNKTIIMRSTTEDENLRVLELEPLDPGFFTRIVHSPSIAEGLALEMTTGGTPADPEACNLWVSDPELFTRLLRPRKPSKKANRPIVRDATLAAHGLCMDPGVRSDDEAIPAGFPSTDPDLQPGSPLHFVLAALYWDS